MSNPKPLRIFFIVGETSGDLLGGRLMAAIEKISGQGGVVFSGIGGPKMVAAGLQSQFPMSDLSVFGLAELLPKVPLILRRMKETVAAILAAKPDLVVTIDAPDFNFRVAKRLKESGIPIVHYVAPTVWAWRPGRAAKISPLFKHLLALFPFEPPYFEKAGLPCTFVGHPLVEAGIEQYPALDIPGQSLLILPGSRSSELHRLLPIFKLALERIKEKYPYLTLLLPTVPHLHDQVIAAVKDWPYPVHFITSEAEKYGAMRGATLALAASGTVALELALANCPAIIAYRIHGLTAALYRHFIKIKYASLVNIMADKMLVPEFIQDNCTVENIAAELDRQLSSPQLRAEQKEGLQAVGARLTPADGHSPSAKAAEIVLAVARASVTS